MNRIINNILAFLAPYKYFIVGGLIIFILLAFAIDSCRTRQREKKIDRIESNIKEQEVISNILTNQKANIETQVKENETNSNQAANNFNSSLRRDSSAYKSTDAENKYCRKFCNDSSCYEWRKTHECGL